MKLKKAFSFIALMNVFALFIVYQQTEIIKFGYKNKQKEDYLEKLTDRRSYLQYEVERNKSLAQINDRLLGEVTDYELPKGMQVVMLTTTPEVKAPSGLVKNSNKERSLFSKAFFWLGREAQAQGSK